METPNTRYRRKREDEAIGNGTPRSGSASGSQDNDRVIWVHDQRLKRAVQMASEHVELAPPTPTQKPRSICSSRPSDSSRPRKRPCRTSRSAPTPLSSATGAGAGSSASAPTMAEVGLELLLQRFELFNSTSSTSTGASVGSSTPGKGKGRELTIDRDISSPVTRSSTSSRVNQHAIQAHSENQRNNLSKKVQSDIQATKQQAAPSPLSNRTNITNHNTRNGHDNDNDNTKSETKSTTRPPPRIHTGKPKPFKTPFLNPPAIRSSPRRTVPPSPLRALPLQTPTRANTKPHNANVDIGEDEPEGNDSFDSFDGLFENGGEEVERLLRAIDGS